MNSQDSGPDYPLRITLHQYDYPEMAYESCVFRVTSAALDEQDHKDLFENGTAEPLYLRCLGVPASNAQLLGDSTDGSLGSSHIVAKLNSSGSFFEKGAQNYGVKLTDNFIGSLSFYLQDGLGIDVASLLGRAPKIMVEFKLSPTK